MLKRLALLFAIGIFASGCALNQVTSGKLTYLSFEGYGSLPRAGKNETLNCKKIEYSGDRVYCTDLDGRQYYLHETLVISVEPFDIGG